MLHEKLDQVEQIRYKNLDCFGQEPEPDLDLDSTRSGMRRGSGIAGCIDARRGAQYCGCGSACEVLQDVESETDEESENQEEQNGECTRLYKH